MSIIYTSNGQRITLEQEAEVYAAMHALTIEVMAAVNPTIGGKLEQSLADLFSFTAPHGWPGFGWQDETIRDLGAYKDQTDQPALIERLIEALYELDAAETDTSRCSYCGIIGGH